MENWLDNLIQNHYHGNYVSIFGLTNNYNVHPFEIYESEIRASVFTFINSYNVYVKFKPFSGSEKSKLSQLVKSHDAVLSILKGKIPDNILNSDIKIYPTSIDDFIVECECGNTADFCGEVIAVLKHLNKALENDPLLIFSLKGFDLKKTVEYPIKSGDEIFSHNFKENDKFQLKDLYSINYNLLSSIGFDEDLFFIYSVLFEDLSDEIDSFFNSASYINFINLKHFTHYALDEELFAKKWGDCTKISLDMDFKYHMSHFGRIKNEYLLFSFLMELIQIDNSVFGDRLSFLLDILKLTFKLIKNNAIIPQLIKLPNDKITVRWVPAFFDGATLKLCRSYYSKCPDDLITLNGESISNENQIIVLISLIMKGFIDFNLKHNNNLRSYVDPFAYDLFFKKPVKFNTYSRKEIIDKISHDLSVFHMNELPFSYAFVVDKKHNNLNLKLKVLKDNQYIDINDAGYDEMLYAGFIYDVFSRFDIETRLGKNIVLNKNKFLKFQKEIQPVLEYINVVIDSPFDISEADLKLELDISTENDEYFTINDLNSFEWKIGIGDDSVSVDEFMNICNHLNSFIKINDKYYSLNKHKAQSIKNDLLFLPNDFGGFELLQISLLERYRNLKITVSERFKKLLNFSSMSQQPQLLAGELRQYQQVGYSWLIQNIKSGFGSILADDMGLGKTIQVLAVILYLKQNNQLEDLKVLIIVPTTLISNWENEIKKFAPSLTYSVYHGINRKFPQDDSDIVLTSFGIVRRDADKFLEKSWFLCVVDEAQNIKNPSTKQTKSVKAIDALNKIALTGTPIENRLLDYWSIFDFTNPGYLTSKNKFKKEYVSEIEKNNNDKILKNLKTITKPFILRRLKTDPEILNELPNKHINDIYCTLSDKQFKLYEKTLNGLFDDLKTSEGISRKGKVLKLITSLKQICNHPAQFLKSKNPKIKDSAKFELLVDILENILDMDEKVIIFTQYVEMGEILNELILKKFNREVLFLHGSVNRLKREDIIDKFQNNNSFPILIATLKTGGVGLNLTAATNVIHYDLWWNPAVENQATDRVYRIGQKEDVMVYRFITKGTLEENIDLMIKNKLELAGKTIDNDETFITEMSDEELMEILTLRR